jgi:hypothetical protein
MTVKDAINHSRPNRSVLVLGDRCEEQQSIVPCQWRICLQDTLYYHHDSPALLASLQMPPNRAEAGDTYRWASLLLQIL